MKTSRKFGPTTLLGKTFSSTKTNTDSPSPLAALRVQGLSVNWGARVVLEHLDVDFPPGKVHLVLGANGSGKTTLLRALMQSIPYCGEVSLADKNLADCSPSQVARHLALVPQFVAPHRHLSVYDYVLLGRYPYLNWLGNYRRYDHEQAQKALARFGLSDLGPRYMHQLSGGERQKVILSRALCQQTKVILLDEPAQSLDPLARQELWDLLFSLAHEGQNLICTTHHLDPLAHPLARGLALRDGCIALDPIPPDPAGWSLESIYGAGTYQKNP